MLPPLGDLVRQKLALTVEWWQRWAARASYDGPYRDQVVRSALALKLLTYAPSGAMIAAPTTSLPERVGGDLNWDYRFCWLRDAAFTARALFGLGYQEDAEAFVSWLLHATRLTRPELRVIYDVFGESNPEETELPHLRRLRGVAPGPDRERDPRPAPARRVRGGHRGGHPLPAQRRRAGPRDADRCSATSAGTSAATGASRTTASGSRGTSGSTTRTRGCSAGWPWTGSSKCTAGAGSAASRWTSSRSTGRRSAGTSRSGAGTRRWRATPRSSAGTRSTRPSCSWPSTGSTRRPRRGCGGPTSGSRSGWARARACSTATSRASRAARARSRMCCFWIAEFLARGGGSLEEAHDAFAQTLGLRQRRRPVRRGDRPEDRGRAGELPAGVHPRRPHQRRAVAGRAGRARPSRGRQAAAEPPPAAGREQPRPEVRR